MKKIKPRKNKLSLTRFEYRVLKATLCIPFGDTRSYAWVAKQISRPKASRAVGRALSKNPFPMLIPCHRVICSDGGLGGYVFGSAYKQKILDFENKSREQIFAK